MVAARSAAMGFNRLVDARFDALNPRTAIARFRAASCASRKRDAFVVVASLVFVARRVAAESDLSACCRRWRSRSCSGTRWPSATPPTRSCSSVWRWRWRRWAAGWRSAGAAAGSRGCWRWRSARGSAASTSCTPARISTSIARTACDRFPCASACRGPLLISRAMHVVAVAVPARRSRGSRRCRALYLAGVARRRRCCSSTSSRSCAPTICRRSSGRST